MIVHPHMRIRRLPSSAAMRPVFLLLFYFFLTVHAAVSVHPSNSSLHLSESSDAAFRIWGFNYLDGQHLAPLTQNLLRLIDLQAKVRLAIFMQLPSQLLLLTIAPESLSLGPRHQNHQLQFAVSAKLADCLHSVRFFRVRRESRR